MDVVVERKQFAIEAGWVAASLSPNAVESIHNGVLLTAADGVLTISGSDGSASVQSRLDAEVAAFGKAVVPRRLLAAVLDKLSDQDARLTLDGTRLVMTCGPSTFRFPTAPAETYPVLPDQPRTVGQVSSEVLVEAVSQVGSACATNDIQPVLTTILMLFEEDGLTLVATNKYRLGKKIVPWIPVRGNTGQAMVPRKALTRVLRSVPPGPISLALDDTGSLFGITAGKRRSVLPVVAGEFPDYSRLLALTFGTEIEFDMAELRLALDRLRLVADKPEIPMRISFDGSEALLTAGESETVVSEAISCKLEGDPVAVTFDSEMLQKAVVTLRGDIARMRLDIPIRPVQLTGSDEDSYLQMVVPLRK